MGKIVVVRFFFLSGILYSMSATLHTQWVGTYTLLQNEPIFTKSPV